MSKFSDKQTRMWTNSNAHSDNLEPKYDFEQWTYLILWQTENCNIYSQIYQKQKNNYKIIIPFLFILFW